MNLYNRTKVLVLGGFSFWGERIILGFAIPVFTIHVAIKFHFLLQSAISFSTD